MTTNDQSKKIGKYQVLRELGNGSIGIVYKARDPQLNRLVAIKVLKCLYLGEKDDETNMALQRFYHEAQLACMLKHPNIVTVFDAGITEVGAPYIVMEYVEGKDLGDIIDERGAIPLDETLSYICPIARAIDYAHTQGIIHRDIKPNNIVISAAGVPHLLDFSVAKLHDTSLTPAGTLLGTPEYMAPEQILGQQLDHRVDLFAFAVVIFETITGQVPFAGSDMMTTAGLIVNGPPKRFDEVDCDLPKALESVLHKALSKNPDLRYQSAAELISNIASALAKSPAPHKRKTVQDGIQPEKANFHLKEEIPASPQPQPRQDKPEWSMGSDVSKPTTNSRVEPQEEPPSITLKRGTATYSQSQIKTSDRKKYVIFFTFFALIIGIVYFVLASIFPNTPGKRTALDTSEAIANETEFIPEAYRINGIETLTPSDLAKLLQFNTNVFVLRQTIPEASKRQIPDLLALAANHVKSPDYYVKVEVLKLLIANPKILATDVKLDTIVDMLNDSDHLVRGYAIKVLATINNNEAIHAIKQHYQRETNPQVSALIKTELDKRQ